MTYEEIFEVLSHSVDYEEFMINYNELIPEITKERKSDERGFQNFMIAKNILKRHLYSEFKQEYKHPYVRALRIAHYVYDINIKEYLDEFSNILKKHIKFIKLFR